MIIRFGFVAMSVVLEDASPSKAVTWKTYQGLQAKDPELALEKVRYTARQNLANCLRLLHYCQANYIDVYRFSSRLIPLATHPELAGWDYIHEMQTELEKLGEFIQKNKMRVTFHPDHFTLINSPKEDVFTAAVIDLAHHCRLFNAMKLNEDAKLIMHVGGTYGNKEEALERFIENWSRLPNGIARRLTLENDDKTFTALETLNVCEKLQVPMIFDVHHDLCNHEPDRSLDDLYPRFAASWRSTGLPPKIHVSSPKCESELRSHHDYVSAGAVYSVLMALKSLTSRLDVMVEAKKKDQAMFRLVHDLGKYEGVTLLNRATLSID